MPPRRSDNPTAVLLVLLACLAGGAGGCQTSSSALPAPRVWAVGDMVNLTEDHAEPTDDLVFDAPARAVNLFSAANETVSFQVVVEAGPTALADVTLACDGLVGPDGARIAPAAVRFFRMWPVTVEQYPAWYLRLGDRPARPTRFYDALIPADAPRQGMPYAVPAGGRLAVWVDLHVGRSVAAGDYAGALTVSAAGAADARLDLKLRVYDFVLPDTRPMIAAGGFDHDMLFSQFLRREGRPFQPTWLDRSDPLVREGLVLLRQLMTLAHEHRLDLVDRGAQPVIKRDMFGAMTIQWDDYDAVVKPYLDGTAFDDRIGCPLWPAPLDESLPDPARYGGYADDEYRATVGSILAQTVQHFRQLGLADRLFLWPTRQAGLEGRYDGAAALARIARTVTPTLPILSELPPAPPTELGWRPPADYGQLYDLLAPPAHLLDVGNLASADGADDARVVFLAPGLAPYAPSLDVLASPADVRAIPWTAAKYKLAGLLLPEVLNWEGDPFAVAPGDQVRLFYPGTVAGMQAVLPSVRLKRLRRGLQDASYVWLLRQRGRETVAQAVIDSLVRYAGLDAAGDNYLDARLDGWAKDAASYQMARRLLAEEVLAAIRPDGRNQQQLLAQRIAWGRFIEQTRAVRVEQVRTRAASANDGRNFRVTVDVDLYNELSRPVAVRLRMGDLPAGIEAVQAEQALDPMAPNQRHTLQVGFVCSYLPTNAAGKLAVPLEIITDMTDRRQIQAEAPLVVCAPARRTISIDGDLSDWPMPQRNAAGDFRLVGRRGRTGTGLATHQTVAYVAQDEQNLYLAFRCDWPREMPLTVRSDNLVRYEQLLAVEEDLVEVLFDPGGRGETAEDLYHLVVKANGVVVAERGVSSDPPLGACRPWAANAKAAVGRGPSYWTVELAVPLASLGDKADEPFWGINFARHTTGLEESSSWSGAPRYFYHPRNLGMLLRFPTELAVTRTNK